MPLFSKEGDDAIYELEDTEEEINLAASKGYKPLIEVTKDGSEYFAIPAEVDELKLAKEKGYLPSTEWENLKKIEAESKVKFTPGQSFVLGAAEQATFGLGDEALARIRSLAPSGNSYESELKAIRYQQEQAEKQNPISSFAGTAVGAIGMGALTGGTAAIAKTPAQAVGIGMLSQGVAGALQGYGESEKETLAGQAADATTAGAISALFGGLGAGSVRGAPAAAAAIGKGAQAVKKATETGVEATKKSVGGISTLATSPVQTMGSARQALIESGRRMEGSGFFAKKLDQLISLKDNFLTNTAAAQDVREAANLLRKELGDDVARLSDKELISYAMMLEGPNPAKRLAAISIAKKTNGDVDEILQAIDFSPDAVAEARLFDLATDANTLAKEFTEVASNLKEEVQKRYGEALEVAKAQFPKQGAGLLSAVQDTVSVLKQPEFLSAPTSTRKTVRAIDSVLKGREGKESWDLVSASTQFERLKTSREMLQQEIKRLRKRGLNREAGVLNGLKTQIDAPIKSMEDMALNDKSYAAFKAVEDSLIKPLSIKDAEGRQVLDPSKVAKLLEEKGKGAQLSSVIDSVRQRTLQLPQEQAKPLLDTLDQIANIKKILENSKAIEAMKKNKLNLAKSETQGLGISLGKDSIASLAITDPEQALLAQANVVKYAKKFLNKQSFKELTPKERLMLIEMEGLIRNKKLQGREDDAWDIIQKKYKKKGVI